MSIYESRYATVEAVQWTGKGNIYDFIPGDLFRLWRGFLIISTANGVLACRYGDYVVRHFGGIYSPWEKERFERRFKLVE